MGMLATCDCAPASSQHGAVDLPHVRNLRGVVRETPVPCKGTRNTVVCGCPPGRPSVKAQFMLSTWKVAPRHATPWSAVVLAARRPDRGGRLPPGRVRPGAGHRRRAVVHLWSATFGSTIGWPKSSPHQPGGGRASSGSRPSSGARGPLIVFADADLDAAEAGTVQRCSGRYLAGADCSSRTCTTPAVDRHVSGDSTIRRRRWPSAPDHVARVVIERARDHGDHVVRGGSRVGDSLHVEPTLIERASTAIVQQEVFGPVWTLQTFSSEDRGAQLHPLRVVGDRVHDAQSTDTSGAPCGAACVGPTRSSSAT